MRTRTRTLLARIERAEQAAKAQSKFASECICFPGPEPPLFLYPIQQEVALEVKCPFHGARFQPFYHLYMAKWRREKEIKYRLSRLDAQYQKAWNASFPPELWPAEEILVEGKTWLRLKDGSMLFGE